jgi:hypothetical protein
MKRICGIIVLAFLAAGQSCDPQSLVPALTSGGNTTNQPAGNDGASTSRTTPTGINASPSGSPRPEIGAEVAIRIVSQSRQDADVIVRYLVASTEVRRTELHVPAGATLPIIGPDLAVVVTITGRHANGTPLPDTTLQLGQQFEAGEIRDYVIIDPDDLCPADPNKYEPGQCGCGIADTDTDGDGTPDCHDACPNDSAKIAPGACGCGQAETDTDGDGTPDCVDACPEDPHKTQPGRCGCGQPDSYISIAGTSGGTRICPPICEDPTADRDGDGVPDCSDGCPLDPYKTAPGACGCGQPDSDYDEDGLPNCVDACPNDSTKSAPGVCGCGVPDTDTDGDTAPDCLDACPTDPHKTSPGICGCGVPDSDSDGDTYPDCIDGCPSDPLKTTPGQCGCDVPEGSCSTLQACCMGSVDCLEMPPDQCLASYGTPRGVGTTCANTMCYMPPMTEACCLSDTCMQMPIGQCALYEGTPHGPGSTCGTATCYTPPPSGIYWSTSSGEIQVTTSSDSVGASAIISGENSVDSLHFSTTDGRLYWISEGMFRSANPDGSDAQTLPFSPIGVPVGLTTDITTGSLCWSEFSSPDGILIYTIPLSVPSAPMLAYSTGGANGVGPVAISSYGEHNLFFAYPAAEGNSLAYVPVPATAETPHQIPTIFGSSEVVAVLAVPSLPDVFWVEVAPGDPYPTSSIRKVSLAGEVSTVLERAETIRGLAFDPLWGKLYWTVPETGAIMRANLDGSGVELFMSEIVGLLDVAVGPAPLSVGQ